MKPDRMQQECYERYQQDGWTEDDIQRIWGETLQMRKLMRENKDKPPREITCMNYENAVKRTNKAIENWLHAKPV